MKYLAISTLILGLTAATASAEELHDPDPSVPYPTSVAMCEPVPAQLKDGTPFLLPCYEDAENAALNYAVLNEYHAIEPNLPK